MKLIFKLYADLTSYLPADAEKHVTSLDIHPGSTPHEIIDRFNIPREQAHLVLLNGVYLNPEERDTVKFKEGDTLAIWPPVAGG